MTTALCHSFQETGSWVWQRIALAQKMGLPRRERGNPPWPPGRMGAPYSRLR